MVDLGCQIPVQFSICFLLSQMRWKPLLTNHGSTIVSISRLFPCYLIYFTYIYRRRMRNANDQSVPNSEEGSPRTSEWTFDKGHTYDDLDPSQYTSWQNQPLFATFANRNIPDIYGSITKFNPIFDYESPNSRFDSFKSPVEEPTPDYS